MLNLTDYKHLWLSRSLGIRLLKELQNRPTKTVRVKTSKIQRWRSTKQFLWFLRNFSRLSQSGCSSSCRHSIITDAKKPNAGGRLLHRYSDQVRSDVGDKHVFDQAPRRPPVLTRLHRDGQVTVVTRKWGIVVRIWAASLFSSAQLAQGLAWFPRIFRRGSVLRWLISGLGCLSEYLVHSNLIIFLESFGQIVRFGFIPLRTLKDLLTGWELTWDIRCRTLLVSSVKPRAFYTGVGGTLQVGTVVCGGAITLRRFVDALQVKSLKAGRSFKRGKWSRWGFLERSWSLK